jgi:hypothetical protein
MKDYLIFKIIGDSDLIEPIGKMSSRDTKRVLSDLYGNEYLDFLELTQEQFNELLEQGHRTGGEDSAILGYLPWMEDSYIITTESNTAIFVVEELQLFTAIMKSLQENMKGEI